MDQAHIIQPSLETIKDLLSKPQKPGAKKPNLVPLYGQIPADLITPSAAYLKIAAHSKSKSKSESNSNSESESEDGGLNCSYSFLFESAATEQVGRYSFVGANPRKVLKTGPGHGEAADPLPALEAELARRTVAAVPGLRLPPLTGGAIGYVGYDCVRYFEPRTARPLRDPLGIPESLFMLFDTIVAFDRFYGVVKVITYLRIPEGWCSVGSSPNSGGGGDDGGSGTGSRKDELLAEEYARATATIAELIDVLNAPEIPLPEQQPIQLGREYTSNIGRDGYERHVTELKKHIVAGDIIQAVPSQRFARPTSLHPFNIYRHLRTVNPSPYLFYIDCGGSGVDASAGTTTTEGGGGGGFQIVGASPELLVKEEAGRIVTHPIAGTVKRGRTPEEDERLAADLRGSLKDRAEHVMLVDLARNDVNRVCDPRTTRVDRLMVVERFSHVQHLVSQVSGVLRPGRTRFDAFRSIFPAGTVSGAPKVRAMELIAELERERRGVYAGAVGYFGYGGVDVAGGEEGRETQGAMDTCIALRTMMVKDGVAYLQAGGGIVFDSDEYEEWLETMNKLGANMQCIASAESLYAQRQQQRQKQQEQEQK